MPAPEIETWTARDLVTAETMNRRVDTVLDYLTRPPAVRVTGREWAAPVGSYTHLPCYPVGQQPAGIAYETQPGMAPTNAAGNVVGLVAPRTGLYRYVVGANIAPGGKPIPGPDQPAPLYLDVAVLDRPDFNTAAVGTNAITTSALPTWSAYSNSGSCAFELSMNEGQFVSVVARTPDLSGINWADPRFHRTACFQELRWIGEIP